MNIIEALKSPRFFGSVAQFRDLTTWRAWLTVLKAIFGLPMDVQDLETFRRHTGRRWPRPGGYMEAVIITGRQSGKSQIAALLAAFAAAITKTRSGSHVLLIAQDFRGAQRVLFSYCKALFDEVAALGGELVRTTADTLELRSGASLSVYPCRPASIRGIRSPLVILDELAHMRSTEGNPVDQEILRAARPTVATTGGRLIVLSSPYAQAGALWDLHRRHFGEEDSSVLVWQASAAQMNGTLPADYLARLEENDREGFLSEGLGEFLPGVSDLFPPDALAPCVPEGVRERAPQPGVSYVAFVDAASGSGKDAFTLAIAHSEDGVAVLDLVRSWKPPFSPSEVQRQVVETSSPFRIVTLTGDRFALGWVAEGFAAQGIAYQNSEKDRSTLYLETLPLVNSGRVLLLDDEEMLREFRGLERRRSTGGRERVDHRPGAHDDMANAAAGALVLATSLSNAPFTGMWMLPGGEWGVAGGNPWEGTWDGLEWRNGRPWAGVCPAEADIKGRPTAPAAIYRDGAIVGYVQ